MLLNYLLALRMMLACELYLQNRDFKGGVAKVTRPIKKIFVSAKDIVIDDKSREEYGSELNNDNGFIQDWLSMPLNTSDAELLNLPDKRTGTRSPSPYVKIYGSYEKNKNKEKIRLSINGKDRLEKQNSKKFFVADCNLDDYSYSFSAEGDLYLSLDKKNYMNPDQQLYEKYLNSAIIDTNGSFSSTKFKEISIKFFEYVKSRPQPEFFIPRITYFEIYILPSTNKIIYNSFGKSGAEKSSNTFIDCFGNECSQYASMSTQTAKFLSFDDPAFTINCTQKEQFYKNLDIGKESLEKINIPSNNVLKIGSLNWIFTDISHPDVNFQSFNRGIYSQLFNNYIRLNKEKDVYSERINLKIICFKINQAKLEILLDENMTMDTMHKLFKGKEEGYTYSFEVLIYKNDKKSKKYIINDYLQAIRNLIHQIPVNKLRLIDIFTRLLRREIFSWINSKNTLDATIFFEKAGFCLKTLLAISNIHEEMDLNEKYAYSIGLIAGRFIKFKRKFNEESNSLKDILTYSKYDREKLRFVFSRIGIGLNLSKASQSNVDKITNFINENQQEEEISDNNASRDYSYFFFKGVYKELGGNE
jgi:hypothetical protein